MVVIQKIIIVST
ncbi:hypothetical protein FWK35_00025776 [Aphis craccivora]|uniref:Uncharacterized protein n=1 Tax=Aphis craccivora TaxID=307492 RepID=A0A6G0YSR5_APHCR|nr:hypothetical protein FWK35_00025776 [Aphis craccivora]